MSALRRVTELVAQCRDIADDDDEVAHMLEKTAWEAALKAIAEGSPDAQLLATAALRTKALGFSRWFA